MSKLYLYWPSVLCIVLTWCIRSAACGLAPTPLEPFVLEEWEIARQRVFQWSQDSRVLTVSLEQFRIREAEVTGVTVDGLPYFLCGGEPAVGCYAAKHNLVQWLDRRALRHEFGHGLMEVLKMEHNGCTWEDWEHTEGCP